MQLPPPSIKSTRFTGPLYLQVAENLRGRILECEWAPDKQMPNEVLLASELSVSVGTVRKALELLEDERLVSRIKGRGTFVSAVSDEVYVDRFSNIYAQGAKVRLQQSSIAVTQVAATPEVQARLQLEGPETVWRIDRFLTAPGQALAIERVCLPERLFPEFDVYLNRAYLSYFGIYRQHYDFAVARVVETISACLVDDAAARQLRLGESRLALRLERVAHVPGVGPVEYAEQHLNLLAAEYRVGST